MTLFAAMVLFYLAVTGTTIQSIDLHTLLTHAPASDPNMMAIREGHDGPDDFMLITASDFTAPALPQELDFRAALSTLIASARERLGAAPFESVEVRMTSTGPVGAVESRRQRLQVYFDTGAAVLAATPAREPSVIPSIRNTIKGLHRMTSFGNWILWLNPLAGALLGVFVITGLVMYFQLLSARRRLHRGGLFWSAGGWWRSLHRWLSICAAAFILVVALSGTWLAVESLYHAMYMDAHRPKPGQTALARANPFSALADGDLQAMLATTLGAYKRSMAAQPIKALRLRIYAGMAQGVVIGGLGDATGQLVFNATSGQRASETEPGYPESGFPFGWQAHQIAKDIHRGDFIGLPGRWMDLFAGAAIVFLSVSGTAMYLQMWTRRRRIGRTALF